MCVVKCFDWPRAAQITQVCVCRSVFVLEREIKGGIICMCVHACPVIFIALYLAATLSCLRCWDGLYHIIYTTNLITVSACFVLILRPPTYPTLEPGWWERPAGSQQCSPALISVTREGLTLHHLWVLQRFEGWGWTGACGASSFQANHSAGLITIPTRCPFQWWSVPWWSMRHSLTLLFYAYLSFIMWRLWDARRALQVCSPGAHFEECNFLLCCWQGCYYLR